MTPKFHTLIISDIRKETDETVSIAFKVPANIQSEYLFEAGQHLTLKTELNGEEVRRSYSICKAPYEGELRVAVKEVEGGVFSHFANRTLRVGDSLDVMTPMGKFTTALNTIHQKSYLFFAAGSGITPIISLIKSILHEEPLSSVTLVYGNKGFATVIFRDELEGLKNSYMNRFSLVHLFSRENLGNPVQKGRISALKCDELFNSFLKHQKFDSVHICGPEEMVAEVKGAMLKQGLDKSNIHFELFNTSAGSANKPADSSPQIESNVKVIMDGYTYELPLNSHGMSILDAAYQAGADVPFACKGGVCCTCKAKIIEGSVSMDVNYGLEEDEVAAGYILTCQSHPTSEKLIVSFDE